MPATNKIRKSMEGRNARLVISTNRVPRSFAWKTWSIKPIVVKHADQVNGEKRPRLSKTLDYYEITAEMYVHDAEVLEAWLELQDAEDAMTAPLDQDGAIRLYPNDGTRKSFVFDELTWDDWDLKQGGRTEKKMCTINLRCTDFKPAKTV